MDGTAADGTAVDGPPSGATPDSQVRMHSCRSHRPVRQPTHRLGRAATELLLDECDNPESHAHQQVMFQPELIVRESTR
ncbi:substrate-binding domain-containing protein [Streptosporangium sp. NBC_01755]|uniref:substrate-binding domain-containing protein n=1 Tax=unclassified Streptosporangium TaxID=2632669 RepID=UPI002DD7D52C|nr:MULTISPECIES: substrate-binding domain-containing protein [unclassified Streptosporangium]WSA22954.1 substrate-binding domain-containing protein [Streptosporangium sp. NBC_01810]WSC98903.1 substrate-binding domain-containing protein [Streptosporangium sp. NBC_01755]